MSAGWLAEPRAALAADRILDAAATLFAERGVTGVGMAEVAAAAGCSRATLYRYWPDRAALRRAFVEREASRVAAQVSEGASGPGEAVLLAVRLVRERPELAAWFTSDAAGLGASAAQALGLGGTDDDARWLVRCVVSLLVMPGRNAADERRLVERYLASVGSGQTGPPSLSPARAARRPSPSAGPGRAR